MGYISKKVAAYGQFVLVSLHSSEFDIEYEIHYIGIIASKRICRRKNSIFSP